MALRELVKGDGLNEASSRALSIKEARKQLATGVIRPLEELLNQIVAAGVDSEVPETDLAGSQRLVAEVDQIPRAPDL